jgi:hypothetical protein
MAHSAIDMMIMKQQTQVHVCGASSMTKLYRTEAEEVMA